MKIQRFTCRILSENCYALSEGGACVIVDPGLYGKEEISQLTDYLSAEGISAPDAILLTHAHFDHTIGVKNLQNLWPGIPVYMHPADKDVLEEHARVAQSLQLHQADFSFDWTPVADGQELSFGSGSGSAGTGDAGGLTFRVISTPGHTPGGVCWYCEKLGLAFTGDTLFADSIGRTDFDHSDYDDEIRSIMEKLMLLPGSTDVYPGHGPSTTIQRERESNPFLEPFNEPEEPLDPDLAGIEINPFI